MTVTVNLAVIVAAFVLLAGCCCYCCVSVLLHLPFWRSFDFCLTIDYSSARCYLLWFFRRLLIERLLRVAICAVTSRL